MKNCKTCLGITTDCPDCGIVSELMDNGWHEDYAIEIKSIFDKHAKQGADSETNVIVENDFTLVVEDLYNLYRKVHR